MALNLIAPKETITTISKIIIVTINIDPTQETVFIRYIEGNQIEGKFVPADRNNVTNSIYSLVIEGDDFTALVTKNTSGGSLYDEIKTSLYNYIMENNTDLQGTVI